MRACPPRCADMRTISTFSVTEREALWSKPRSATRMSLRLASISRARIPATFVDGQVNTILFAEKYARCDGTGLGGTWWMRGVFHGAQAAPGQGSDDSYPGDRLSAVFGGGRGADGTRWLQGLSSKFQVQPKNPGVGASAGGKCDKRLASTPHSVMNVAMADGSVKGVAQNVNPAIWAGALTPAGREVLPGDW